MLPTFMQNNTNRGSLNQVLDKSLKDNNYKDSYFVSKPTTLRVLSNSQVSKNRVSELSKHKKIKQNVNESKLNNGGDGYRVNNKTTFYKLLS